MLEQGLQADNAFVTLTYKPTTDPEKDIWSLEPLHHRRFMDALRKRIKPLKVRFFCVGEYGDQNDRPHFHYALFGYPSCQRPRTRLRTFRCCAACDLLEDVWGRGFVKNLPLEIGSARYVARYVIKKMTRFDDPRLGNRHPEFARMSLKPGIGAGVVEKLAAIITRYNLLREGDVPVTLAHGGQQWPLGRYLRKHLRKELGLDERSPTVVTAEGAYAAYWSEENQAMRDVQKAALSDPENPSLKYHLLKASDADRRQLVRRHRLFDKKGKL